MQIVDFDEANVKEPQCNSNNSTPENQEGLSSMKTIRKDDEGDASGWLERNPPLFEKGEDKPSAPVGCFYVLMLIS